MYIYIYIMRASENLCGSDLPDCLCDGSDVTDLCLSINPNAIHIHENDLDKVDWCNLSRNPNAIRILENNFDNTNWRYLSWNPNAILPTYIRLYVCMYVCMYACMHACMHACMYVCM